ncbi:MAG: hypothetical protein IPL40_13425 [Proteobacteria bacterium]|nr:hypothetical protein [Pseudomonadota bacterium]
MSIARNARRGAARVDALSSALPLRRARLQGGGLAAWCRGTLWLLWLLLTVVACGYRPVHGPRSLLGPRALCLEPVRATRVDEPQLAGVLGSALSARLAAQGWRCTEARALRLRVQLVRLATVATALQAGELAAERRELIVTAWLRDHLGRTIWRSGLVRVRRGHALDRAGGIALSEQLRASAGASLAVAAASELAALLQVAAERSP